MVADNGKGYALSPDNNGGNQGVGTKIVKGLASQLDAEIEWRNENGTAVFVSIPAGYQGRNRYA